MEYGVNTIEQDFLQLCHLTKGGLTFQYLHEEATLPESYQLLKDGEWLEQRIKKAINSVSE